MTTKEECYLVRVQAYRYDAKSKGTKMVTVASKSMTAQAVKPVLDLLQQQQKTSPSQAPSTHIYHCVNCGIRFKDETEASLHMSAVHGWTDEEISSRLKEANKAQSLQPTNEGNVSDVTKRSNGTNPPADKGGPEPSQEARSSQENQALRLPVHPIQIHVPTIQIHVPVPAIRIHVLVHAIQVRVGPISLQYCVDCALQFKDKAALDLHMHDVHGWPLPRLNPLHAREMK